MKSWYFVGKWVGDPRGLIRSDPKAGKDLECPCKVQSQLYDPLLLDYCLVVQVECWQYQSSDNTWTNDDTITVDKVRTWGHDYH